MTLAITGWWHRWRNQRGNRFRWWYQGVTRLVDRG